MITAGALDIQPYDLDDDLMAATVTDGQPRLRVSHHRGAAVVLGRGGRPERELRLANVQGDGVKVLQRPGGGCAVVLDPGNVIVAVTLPLPGIGEITSAFARISRWLIEGLAHAGVPGVEQRGISDLALNGRKIGGACVYRTRNLLYYTTTLLVAPDLDLVDRYLLHPPREPAYRQGRRHRDFLGCISDVDVDTEPERFAALLRNSLDVARIEGPPGLPG